MTNEEISIYLSGKKLYGDDFSQAEIKSWYDDEKEAYSELISEGHQFNFDLMNFQNAFKYLPKEIKFDSALSFGGADAEELIPIIDKIKNITLVDPSDFFQKNELGGKKINRIKPTIEGNLLFENCSFDIITCFGVLHHIPNVSFILSEFHRCLKPRGFLLIREPINSMGDWRQLRKLTTKRERGIPLNLFREWIAENKFKLINETLCEFSIFCKMPYYRRYINSSRVFISLDKFFSKIFKWNYNYHSYKKTDKVKPLSVYYVLRK
jgi:SAM-dependent methyltransferase